VKRLLNLRNGGGECQDGESATDEERDREADGDERAGRERTDRNPESEAHGEHRERGARPAVAGQITGERERGDE